VAVLSGRVHYYEGHDMAAVTSAVRALAVLGARSLLLSNAAGGVNPAFRPGELMVIRDHINLMGVNPLRGPNAEALGPRFPDMTVAYDADLRAAFHRAALRLGQTLHEGVYIAVSGPSYETPAEIRAFGILGSDAVGMSTVPEVIAARHAGLRVAAVSCITNMGAGLSGGLLDHDEVKQVGAAVGLTLSSLFEEVIADLA
jgi:purine-nucleoside phosphorylase